MLSKEDKKIKNWGIRPHFYNKWVQNSTFSWNYWYIKNQLELSFFQNVAKTTKRSFSLWYSICNQVQGHLHLDKSTVPWIESLITTQCVLFCPCVGYLPFWKIKKFGFFSIVNPVLSYFQSIFAQCHCFTSKLRKIKRKDKEIKKINNLTLRKMINVELELTTSDFSGQCAYHSATKYLKLSVYLSYL